MDNHKISLNRRLKKTRIQKISRLKRERWYAGFQDVRKPEELIKLISQKVQEFQIGHIVPLVRIEKNAKGKFYFFIAIESETLGKFPKEFENYLRPLPCFKSPIKGSTYFSYEQIKPMVGAAHDVWDYTNPIPYIIPNSIVKSEPFGQFIELETSNTNCDRASKENLIKLLDWLSAKGNSSWEIFQAICQSLGIEQPSRVFRKLKLLGYLEASANGKKWSIAPTALVPLKPDSENLEFYLCGQQNARLRQELRQFAEIKEQSQPVAFGLPRFKIEFRDRATYEQLETLCGVTIHKPGNIAQRLAECLPTLEQWQANLPVVGGITCSQRDWKYYTSGTFQDCTLPKETGLYEMRRDREQKHPDRTLFYEANTDSWRQGDWYGLRFLTLHHRKELQECHYHPEQKQLAIPYSDRWPQLYERALVLASGYLPSFHKAHEPPGLIYRNITLELAYWLTEHLTITCRGL